MAPAGSARAAAGWQRPIQLASAVGLDVFGVQVGFSAQNAAALAYGVQDVDAPGSSRAFVAERSASGRLSRPRRVAGAQQPLAVAFDGASGALLVGTSPTGLACCSTVQAQPLAGGRRRTLVRDLAGATEGRLLSFAGRLLAVIGTERGVWVAQSPRGERFAASRRLNRGDALNALDAIAAPGEQTVLVWADSGGGAPDGTRTIFVARGSARSAPSQARRAITVSAGHAVDELALARGADAGAATAIWIESWSDADGRFHSQVMAADLTHTPARHALSARRELASGLSVSSDARGGQAVAWKSCGGFGDCSVRAVSRTAHGRFTSAQQLGAIDASESPALAISQSGETLLGRVRAGHVFASSRRAATRRFGSARLVSATNYASELQLTFGPARTALATWTQGTLGQAVMGATYSSG